MGPFRCLLAPYYETDTNPTAGLAYRSIRTPHRPKTYDIQFTNSDSETNI